MKDQIAAIIPARGGSKRIEKKNIRPFADKSLLRWSVIQALCSREIDKVYVVTDSEEIAEEGFAEGAEVIWQPGWMCGSIYGGGIATFWAADVLRKLNNIKDFVILLCITPTRKPNDLDDAIALYRSSGQTYLGSGGPIGHPGFFYRSEDGKALSMGTFPYNTYLTYSHVFSIADLKWWWADQVPDGTIDFEVFREPEKFFKDRPAKIPVPDVFYEVERWQCVDIDEWHEFVAAERVFEEMILKGDPDVYKRYSERARAEAVDSRV